MEFKDRAVEIAGIKDASRRKLSSHMNDSNLELLGEVIDVQRNGFKIKLETGSEVFAKLAGKLRINNIEILLGDKVSVKVSVYDVTTGLIVRRHKK